MQKKFSLKDARKASQSIIRRQTLPAPEPVKIFAEVKEAKDAKAQAIPCPPHFPDFDIDVLRVTKVFEECRVVDVNEVIDVVDAPEGAVDVECLGAQLITEPECVINADNTVTATFSFITAYQFIDEDGDPIGDVQIIETLDETRTIFLSRAGEEGLECIVEIFLECIQCFVSDTGPLGEIVEVTCCVGKQIVFKLVSEVQLLIPTFGYAPVPPECEQVAGECPDFNPVWPPYPPQSPDFPPLQRKKGCGCKNKE